MYLVLVSTENEDFESVGHQRITGKRIFIGKGTIHLLRSQNCLKNQRILPPDTHTYLCASGGKK